MTIKGQCNFFYENTNIIIVFLCREMKVNVGFTKLYFTITWKIGKKIITLYDKSYNILQQKH